MSHELLKVAADKHGTEVSEFGEGNARVEEWWDADDDRKKQNSSFKKNVRQNNVYKAILFTIPYLTK